MLNLSSHDSIAQDTRDALAMLADLLDPSGAELRASIRMVLALL